jgi:hypothetical protein
MSDDSDSEVDDEDALEELFEVSEANCDPDIREIAEMMRSDGGDANDSVEFTYRSDSECRDSGRDSQEGEDLLQGNNMILEAGANWTLGTPPF